MQLNNDRLTKNDMRIIQTREEEIKSKHPDGPRTGRPAMEPVAPPERPKAPPPVEIGIKSPDDVLRQKAPNQTQLLAQELEILRSKYEADKEAWRFYQTRIQSWKKEVEVIVEGLKKEIAIKTKLVSELRAENRQLKGF